MQISISLRAPFAEVIDVPKALCLFVNEYVFNQSVKQLEGNLMVDLTRELCDVVNKILAGVASF